jgi:transcriptional regulator with XRE-family HTH domain
VETKAAFALEATRLRRETGLTAEQIARATGAATSTVRGWIGRHSEPKGLRAERVAELAALTERLELVMPRSYIRVWLSKPIEALDFEKPLDLIAAGEYRRVAKVISAIEDPGAV